LGKLSRLIKWFSDWFKAGKGPDPDKALLDDQMDSYFAKKGAANASMATGNATAPSSTTA
jgi:hypothetical protein